MRVANLFFTFIAIVLSSVRTHKAPTHFETLGVKQTSSQEEIKKQYRALAKKYHPDKNKDDAGAQAKFIDISNAYEVLSDDNKRKEYIEELQYGRNSFNGIYRQNRHSSQDFGSPRNMHTQYASYKTRFENSEEPEIYMHRGADGRIYYTTARPKYQRESHFEYSYTFGTSNIDGTELSLLKIFLLVFQIFLLPIIKLVVVGVTVYSFLQYIFNSLFSKANTVKGKNGTQSKSSDEYMKLPIVSEYELSKKGVILIISLNQAADTLLLTIRKRFVNDPLCFLRTPSIARAEDARNIAAGNDIESYSIVAMSKSGSRWTSYTLTEADKETILSSKNTADGDNNNEDDQYRDSGNNGNTTARNFENWLIKLLDGRVTWQAMRGSSNNNNTTSASPFSM